MAPLNLPTGPKQGIAPAIPPQAAMSAPPRAFPVGPNGPKQTIPPAIPAGIRPPSQASMTTMPQIVNALRRAPINPPQRAVQ